MAWKVELVAGSKTPGESWRRTRSVGADSASESKRESWWWFAFAMAPKSIRGGWETDETNTRVRPRKTCQFFATSASLAYPNTEYEYFLEHIDLAYVYIVRLFIYYHVQIEWSHHLAIMYKLTLCTTAIYILFSICCSPMWWVDLKSYITSIDVGIAIFIASYIRIMQRAWYCQVLVVIDNTYSWFRNSYLELGKCTSKVL